MNIPVPPKIPSDSNNKASKSSLLNSLTKLELPSYQSTNDIISPAIGQLIYVNGDLAVYNGSNWETITSTVMIQQGPKLVGTGTAGTPVLQGISVALSEDGDTLAVGGRDDDSGIGAVWIFTRSAGVWNQQGPKLVGTGVVGPTVLQGQSVSLSGDGNTLAVGGPVDDTNIGAVWIFTRSAGAWNQQGLKLVGNDASGIAEQGSSVSLSSDGDTLAVGGPADDTNIGATWIFTRSGVSWNQQGSKLVGTGLLFEPSKQGTSVSLSSDGNTLAVGGRNDDAGTGATWIFTRSGVSWNQQGLKLVGTGDIYPSTQGQSVSLSADGNTLAVGGDSDDNYIGAIWIFTRSAGVWAQQGDKLVGTGYIGPNVYQGTSVSLSSDGNRLAVGAYYDDNLIGATWIFKRNAGVWLQQGSKLVGTGYINYPSQGNSVSLSSDGNTLAVGGNNDNTDIGATWIFTQQ